MKPSFEHVLKGESVSSLKNLVLDLPDFEPFWHYHPEFELTYIIHGTGKRIVGDCIEPFFPGDLVLLGPDLPHTWNSFRDKDDKKICRAVVFQFGAKLIPGTTETFPEFDSIRRLLKIAGRGISFDGKKTDAVGKKLLRLSKVHGLAKLSSFWLLLDELGKMMDYTLLAGDTYSPPLNKYHGERINKVFRFVADNFHENIQLCQVARLVYMTETSFSRFFRAITGETFIDYLNNFRISQACRLLVSNKEKDINQVAAECGYRSSTHFNHMFQLRKKCSPSDFRRRATL
jgi:AraC-like DNA-binding protein